jgi:DNA-binding response OmpR family regulator
MRPARAILLVEPDAACGRALAEVLRRGGDTVRVVRTSSQALLAAGRVPFDLAVVDLLVRGGGVELARKLARQVPSLYLSVGAQLLGDELLEAAFGFPILRKARMPALLARPRREAPPATKPARKPVTRARAF